MAGLFISSPSRSYWTSDSSDDYHKVELHDPHTGGDLAEAEGPFKEVGMHSSHEDAHALENNTIAEQLYNEVKILCWIMTNPSNHQRKAKHVLKTWGSRCNKIIFMSSVEGTSFFTSFINCVAVKKYGNV